MCMYVQQGYVWRVGNSRPSILPLVPTSLQHLRVDFTGNAGIFAAGPGYRASLQHYQSDERQEQMRPAYTWMTDLVDPDPDVGLPELRKLAVVEAPDHAARGVMQWRIPTPLADAFRHASVMLELQLRA